MEAANVDAVEDASFLAELDALEGAAARKKKLDRLIAEKQKEIREAKKSRGRGGDEFTGGRMSKEKQDEENKRQAELSRLQDGLLPGEQNRPPPPSNRDLLASAAARIRCPGPPVGQPTPTILPHNRCSAKWPRHLPVPPHI